MAGQDRMTIEEVVKDVMVREHGVHVEALKKFWPTGCAHWHALANVSAPERRRRGVLWAGQELRQRDARDAQGLAGELRRGVASRLQIAKAQTSTQGRIGCPLGAEPWTGALYRRVRVRRGPRLPVLREGLASNGTAPNELRVSYSSHALRRAALRMLVRSLT